MENQERHKQKIDILAKCIDANAITLQEALMLLDADIIKPEPAVEDSSSTQWNGQRYPHPVHPLIGTQTLPYYGTVVGTPNITFGTSTGGNVTTTMATPQATTLTNTVGSINENTD